MNNAPAAQRVAVISVHGVADQQPGQTVQELTALLQAQLPQQPAFTAQEIMISVDSLGNSVQQHNVKPARLPHSEFAQSRFDLPAQDQDFDIEFSAHMLRDHEITNQDATYRTHKWHANTHDTAIDVYEMYWADLSRLGAGGWRILSAMYQLIFHLSSLGRHTMDLARAASTPSKLLSWLSRTCAANEFALIRLIAMGNLALLATWLCIAIVSFASSQAWTLTAGLLVVYNIVLFYMAWQWRPTRPWLSHAGVAAALLCMALAGTILLAWSTQQLSGPGVGAALLAVMPLALGLTSWMATGIARRNPMSPWWAGVTLGGWTFIILLQYWRASDWPWLLPLAEVLSIGANAAVYAFVLSLAGWAMLGIAQLLFAAGAVLSHTRGSNAQDTQRDTQRAVCTAMLAMMISTSLFAIITISLWALLLTSGLPQDIQHEPLHLWLSPSEQMLHSDTSVHAFVYELLAASAAFFKPALLALALLGMTLFLAFLPSLIAEFSPRSGNSDSTRMGHWLDAGLQLTGMVVVVIAVLYFGVMVWQVAEQTMFRAQINVDSIDLLYATALVLAASATTLVATGTHLSRTLGRWRVVLDTVLDIDNYLREHPRSNNPRARIYARYCALLAHIAQQGYARIVIVAHSQGTVITADLLRLLHHPVAQGTPYGALATQFPLLRLVTAGSPLKQLYRARFAHLYRWIDAQNSTLWPLLKSRFGLVYWLNVYRSGDYVGRDFWRTTPRYALDAQPLAISTDRAELCIGAGGHTHYFDNVTPAFSKLLCDEILQNQNV
jgi:hypothetical protein